MKNSKNTNLQTEVDACYLYNKLAEVEDDPTVANVFRQMSEIEKGHAEAFLQRQGFTDLPSPSFRARALNRIGKIFGYDYILGVLMDTEKSISTAVIAAKNKNKIPITGTEANHVTILRSLLETSQRSRVATWLNSKAGTVRLAVML